VEEKHTAVQTTVTTEDIIEDTTLEEYSVVSQLVQ
jgi:hypothetical protein